VLLVISSSGSVDAGSGTVKEVFETGMEAEEFLHAFLSLKSLLLSFLTPCGTMGLFNNVVAACRGNHLLVVDRRQSRDCPDRPPVTSELIGTDDLWDGIFAQKLNQKTLCRLRISVPLEQDIQHEAVLVYRLPEPVSNAINGRTHFVLSVGMGALSQLFQGCKAPFFELSTEEPSGKPARHPSTITVLSCAETNNL